ncbi:596_t:CDS:2 [Scutellospora calospora]|uniref:596_t:CDS:1 n=1 Tax=Scutellospora calospora TaxID=85575 RepID=A0ACA9MJZ5_9GLOM|nr:596_t:CDS:2 [Scutellospora calospora]
MLNRFLLSKINPWVLIGIICITITLIDVPLVTADLNSTSDSSDSDCVVCTDVPKCPSCPSGTTCVLTVRTCKKCPVASCNSTVSPSNSNGDNGSSKLIPAVICGVLALIVLAVAIYFLYKRKSKSKGIKLDNGEEVSSMYSENVIPIAYIPPPQDTYSRTRMSIVSAGTTPLGSPLHKNTTSETLIDFIEDDDAISEVDTKSSSQSTYNGSSDPNTPKTAKSFLTTPSTASSPGSPTKSSIDTESNNDVLPSIDIERPSTESSRPQLKELSQQHHLDSPSQDQIEGRQSFGLFGGDEVYSKEPKSPELLRESVISSTSTNARSTMLSDEGEIMIFWGGDEQ